MIMNLDMNRGMLLALLIICLGIGSCTAEENTDYITYVQGGVSSLAAGTNGTMVLTIADVIPYYGMEVVNRTILMPLTTDSAYQLPLNAALALNGVDGEAVYLVKIKTWSFDSEKKALSLDVEPVEFYEGSVLKKFTDVKQDLSADKVGKELSTGLYLEVIGQTPANNMVCDAVCSQPGSYRKYCGC